MKHVWISIIVLVLFMVGCQKESAMVSQAPEMTQTIAKEKSEQGLLTPDDYVRLVNVQTSIYKKHSLTDEEIAFCGSLLEKGPVKKTDENRIALQRLVLQNLTGKKTLTDSQKDAIYKLSSPYLQDDDAITQQAAILVIASMKDARAAETLDSVAKTAKNEAVKRDAKEFGDKLRTILGNKS